MSRLRIALASAALAASIAPFATPAASADPWPPPPLHVGMCTLWWEPVPHCVW